MREGINDIFDDYHFCDWFKNLKVNLEFLINSFNLNSPCCKINPHEHFRERKKNYFGNESVILSSEREVMFQPGN